MKVLHGIIGSEAWILLGDFNAVMRVNERTDFESFDTAVAAEFNACIGDIDVEDLNAMGFFLFS